jgi:hypothetical protein
VAAKAVAIKPAISLFMTCPGKKSRQDEKSPLKAGFSIGMNRLLLGRSGGLGGRGSRLGSGGLGESGDGKQASDQSSEQSFHGVSLRIVQDFPAGIPAGVLLTQAITAG